MDEHRLGGARDRAVTAIAVTAMLLVRRRAPEGSRFTDGDRASGVFGVLATGFSVLLGLVVFLAFESYDQSRRGRGGGSGARPAGGDRPVPRRAGRRQADRRARVLRPLGRSLEPRADAGTWETHQPVGRADLRDRGHAEPAHARAAGGLRQVSRRDVREAARNDRIRERNGDPAYRCWSRCCSSPSSSSSTPCSSPTARRAR